MYSKVGRVDLNAPKVAGHKQDVLEIAWNPFNDNIIASSSEDATVKIWEIPDGGLVENLTQPLLTLEGVHQRRVGHVAWNPVAANILLSASHDHIIAIWNLESGEAINVIECHPDLIFSISWNHNGSKIATTCKDKQLRVIDAHKGEVLQVIGKSLRKITLKLSNKSTIHAPYHLLIASGVELLLGGILLLLLSP